MASTTTGTNVPTSGSGGSSLASTLAAMGIPFTLSPNSSSGNYDVTTDSENQGMLNSAGITGSESSSDYGTLAGVFGNADTSNDGAGSGVSNNNGDETAASKSGLASFIGMNGAAIVIGLVFVAAAVYGMVK